MVADALAVLALLLAAVSASTAQFWTFWERQRGSGPNSVEPGLLRNNEAREFGRDMKVSEVLRMLHNDGWCMIAAKGSRRQLKRATKAGRVTAAGKPSNAGLKQ
jgi:predicted RNA binding protein YcfA (HicA-like mRNA interferase family)